jgi:3-keto-5-aminohexanoate cleavage enzyme
MSTPLIVEVAINGLITKTQNPHVPLSPDEMAIDIRACLDAGAAIVHAHAGDPYVGKVQRHASKPYIDVFGEIIRERPDAILYPTLPAGPFLPIDQRYAHINELADAGLLRMAPIDPGTMNWGSFSPTGEAEEESFVYQNTFADVRYAFNFCIARKLGCTMSIFEPGFLQIVLAHGRNGTLPPASVIKLEFSAGRLVFGLKPNREGLEAYLSMLEEHPIPWMVNLRDGDLNNGFGRLAIERGAHVRVGIEDYGGERTPSNRELVAEIAELGRSLGRPTATPLDAAAILKLESLAPKLPKAPAR